MLDIKVVKKGNNIYLIELNGSIDSDTHIKLESELNKIINENTKAVIFDMRRVGYVSSIGIRVMIGAKKSLEAKGASFAMVNLQPQIKKVFDVMKLLPMFEIFDGMPELDKYIDQIIKEEIDKETA